jgi:N-acetylglutamate synthase-like GNAT family acetyltransferase
MVNSGFMQWFPFMQTELACCKSETMMTMSAAPQASQIQLRLATEADIPEIVALVNRAFQVEAFFLINERTDLANVTEMFQKGEFLLAEIEGQTLGCVYLEKRGERAYFGMLSVEPNRKGFGLGRFLIDAVEERARKQGCVVMDITVVNLRTELPPFYQRFGYEISGELSAEHIRSRIPCHLIRMSKPLARV